MLSSSSSVQLKVSYFIFTRQMAASYSFTVPQTASSRRLRDAAVNHLLSGQSQPTAVFNTVVSATNHSLSRAASHTECLRSDEPCFPTVTPTWLSTLLCTLTCKRRRRRGRRVRFLTNCGVYWSVDSIGCVRCVACNCESTKVSCSDCCRCKLSVGRQHRSVWFVLLLNTAESDRPSVRAVARDKPVYIRSFSCYQAMSALLQVRLLHSLLNAESFHFVILLLLFHLFSVYRWLLRSEI